MSKMAGQYRNKWFWLQYFTVDRLLVTADEAGTNSE